MPWVVRQFVPGPEPPVSVGRLRRPPVAGRYRGSLRDLCGLCVHPFCTREGREPWGPIFMRRDERAPAHDDSVVGLGNRFGVVVLVLVPVVPRIVVLVAREID